MSCAAISEKEMKRHRPVSLVDSAADLEEEDSRLPRRRRRPIRTRSASIRRKVRDLRKEVERLERRERERGHHGRHRKPQRGRSTSRTSDTSRANHRVRRRVQHMESSNKNTQWAEPSRLHLVDDYGVDCPTPKGT